MMKARLGRKQSTEEQLHVCDDVTSPDEMVEQTFSLTYLFFS